jgi:hypothetical protein
MLSVILELGLQLPRVSLKRSIARPVMWYHLLARKLEKRTLVLASELQDKCYQYGETLFSPPTPSLRTLLAIYATGTTDYIHKLVLIGVFCVMTACRWVPTFWRNIQPPSAALNMKALCSSKMSVPTYETIRCHNPEDHSMNLHFRQDVHRLHRLFLSWRNHRLLFVDTAM